MIVAGFSSEPVGATIFGKLLRKGHGGFGRLAAMFTVALLSVFARIEGLEPPHQVLVDYYRFSRPLPYQLGLYPHIWFISRRIVPETHCTAFRTFPGYCCLPPVVSFRAWPPELVWEGHLHRGDLRCRPPYIAIPAAFEAVSRAV